ncbi:MAG: Ig-like domain-containing protein [Candidatus Nanopelagicales bacterium]
MALTWFRARPRSVVSATVFAVGAASVAALALTAETFPPPRIESHDGGVWVTNVQGGEFSRFIKSIRQQDQAGSASSTAFDVLQVGSQVVLVDNVTSAVRLIDPAVAQPGDEIPLGTTESVVTMGGPSGAAVVAVMERSSGDVWATTAAELPQFVPADAQPLYTAGPGAAIAVDQQGRVLIASRQNHRLVSWSPSQELVESDLPPGVGDQSSSGPAAPALQITAVGADAIVLDPQSRRLALPSGVVPLGSGESPQLQQPGPSDGSVLVATTAGLAAYALGDGQAVALGEPVRATAAPTAPVRVERCGYGAFVVGSGAVQIRACDGVAAVTKPLLGRDAGTAAGADEVSSLVYRVNRNIVALNDARSGAIWDASGSLERVDDWDRARLKQLPESNEVSTKEEEKPSCDDTGRANAAPVAVPDGPVGARQGQPVVIPVLANDTDRDCDVLALQGLPTVESGKGEIALVGDGRLVQYSPAAGVTGRVEIAYKLSDGVNPAVDGKASVDVAAAGAENHAPEAARKPATAVEQRKSVTYNVINDFKDKDGDPLQVVAVAVPGGEGTARFSPDGLVTYQDGGKAIGKIALNVTVSDGSKTGTGNLIIDVRAGDIAPTAREDFVQAVVGVPVDVLPLANDSDPNEDAISLASISKPTRSGQPTDGVTAVPDKTSGRVTVTASEVGTYLFSYQISAGPAGATGRMRVDVVDRGANRPPAAMVDVVSVRVGKVSVVDVLANDSDPDGDVIAALQVALPADGSVQVQVDRQRYVRVTPYAQLSGPLYLSYTLSDGRPGGVATGTIVVRPVAPGEASQAPIARSDEAKVRAGGVLSIPVLANDLSPNGDRLSLAGLVTAPTKGRAWADQATVRYAAGSQRGQDRLDYRVVDETGTAVAGQVRITITAPERNSAPVPPVVEARVLLGGKVTVDLPLAGSDPDGDLVFLDSVNSASSGNVASRVPGTNKLVFQSSGSFTGTDVVTYRACDAVAESLCSRGVLKVGVYAKPSENAPPVAATDKVLLRPGKRAAVDVIANDSDPEDDDIAFAPQPLGPEAANLKAQVDGGAVVLTAPRDPGEYKLTYRITDRRNQPVEGIVAVTVSSTAPLAAPLAVDDIVTDADRVAGAATVDVDVLANDSDPDGTPAGLTVSLGPDATGAVVQPDRTVLVTLTPQRRVLVYQVTDEDGNTGTAFIAVPASTGNIPPREKTPSPDLTVNAGEALVIPISAVAEDPDGSADDLRIASESRTTASPASAPGLVKDARTLVYQPPKDTAETVGRLAVPVTDGTAETVINVVVTIVTANRPPVFTPVPVRVEEGATEAVAVPLEPLATDPDTADAGKPIPFALEGAREQNGIKVSIDGGVLSATAPSAKAGASATFGLLVGDPAAGADQVTHGKITVSVITTTKAPPEALTDTVERIDEGKTTRVAVLSNDTTPFEGEADAGLKLLSASVMSGLIDVTPDNSDVVVTSRSGFAGPAQVRYTMADKLGRRADGIVTMVVWGLPTVPERPRRSPTRPRRAQSRCSGRRASPTRSSAIRARTWCATASTTGPAALAAARPVRTRPASSRA